MTRNYKRDARGRFAKVSSRKKAPKSTLKKSSGVTYHSKRGIAIVTIGSNSKGNLFFAPIPMRTIETQAFKNGKLIGFADSRVTRKRGVVVENIYVAKPNRGSGVSTGLLKSVSSVSAGRQLTASAYQTRSGTRLASRQGANVSRVKAAAAGTTANMDASYRMRMEYARLPASEKLRR